MSRLADRFRRWLGKVEATEKRDAACNFRDDIARQLVTERNRSREWRRRCMKARTANDLWRERFVAMEARGLAAEMREAIVRSDKAQVERMLDRTEECSAALEAELREILKLIGPGVIQRTVGPK